MLESRFLKGENNYEIVSNKDVFSTKSRLIAIVLWAAIRLPAWAQGAKPVAPAVTSVAPKANPALAPSATSSLKSAKSAPFGESERTDMSLALNASGRQGHVGPIECLQYELHMAGAKPGLAAAKDEELKVTIKVDKTTPRFWAAAMKGGELFQNVTLSNSAQTPAFEIKLSDAVVAAVSRDAMGDAKRGEDLEVVTFKFAGLEVSRGNR